mgnify:CR=1 FL=1
MTHAVLTALRDRVIDDTQPLPGLLRTCLMLGAETGSQSLREWARYELNGYTADAELPPYRRIYAGMRISYVSGYNVVSGQAYAWYNLPSKAREIVPEQLELRGPLAELEQMAAQDSASFGTGPLSVALQIINKDLPFGQQVHQLAYSVPGATLIGIVDRIRTTLVELVADLMAANFAGDLDLGHRCTLPGCGGAGRLRSAAMDLLRAMVSLRVLALWHGADSHCRLSRL